MGEEDVTVVEVEDLNSMASVSYVYSCRQLTADQRK